MAVLQLAIELVEHTSTNDIGLQPIREAVINTAYAMWDFVAEVPKALLMFLGDITEQGLAPRPPAMGNFDLENNVMAEAVTLTDTQQVVWAIAPVDSKGQPVSDTLTWSVDNEAAASLVVADDNMSVLVVAGLPGSAAVNVTDGNLSDVLAVTVTTGGVAALQGTVGTPEEQPAAPTG